MNIPPAASDIAPAARLRTPSGPRGQLLLGNLRDFLRNPLPFIEDAARHGDVVQYRIANMTWYQCNHPAGIQRILQDNHRN